MDVGERSRCPATARGAGTTAGKPATVLVVAYDVAKRNQLEGWLEWAGYEVCGCPGPGLPATCPQIRGRSCPLTKDIDLVVLDLELRGDFEEGSPPSWVLLDSYLERGSRVVALADLAANLPLLDVTGCTLVPRGLDEQQLLASVRRALAA